MYTYPGMNIRKQRRVRLIANCDLFRVRKRIAVSDFLLNGPVFHRLERGEEMAELLAFGINYFVVVPVDSN